MLYFFPRGDNATDSKLTQLGLSHLCRTRPKQTVTVTSGPGDSPGLMVTWRQGLEQCPGYDVESQTWQPAAGREDLWLGWPTDQPPRPEDFIREALPPMTGVMVELGDGNPWTIPVARYLPRVVSFPDGQAAVPGEPEARYAWLVKQCERLWRAWETENGLLQPGEQGEQIDFAEYCTLAVAILSVHYCLSPIECDAMGLLTTDNIVDLCKAFGDWHAWLTVTLDEVDAEKKNADPAAGTGDEPMSSGATDD